MTPDTDSTFRLSGIERGLLRLLKVPEAPQPPDGSPESIRIFRAGQKYYLWTVIMWAFAAAIAGFIAASASIPLLIAIRQAPALGKLGAAIVLVIIWSVYFAVAIVSFISRRLNFGLRWYIVTDRSLRIRSGIFQVNELTMTYSNVQEIRVASGPLQNLLGIADVEVQAAGGGGDARHGGGGHVGRFSGVDHAADIRDLIVERLRRYRDSGLGEPTHLVNADPGAELTAASRMLDEARALRASLESAR